MLYDRVRSAGKKSGEGYIVCIGDLDQEQIEFVISGISEISLQGNVNKQYIEGSGCIEVYNFGLTTKQTDIDISGEAFIEVKCVETLNIDGKGSVEIHYKGFPHINNQTSGDIIIKDSN